MQNVRRIFNSFFILAELRTYKRRENSIKMGKTRQHDKVIIWNDRSLSTY